MQNQNNYNAYQQPTQQNQQSPQAQYMPFGQVVAAWVGSKDIAERMYLDPNKIAFMVSETEKKIYIKCSDQFGRCTPIDTYEFVTPPPETPAVDLSGYVKMADFENFAARFGDVEEKINSLFDSFQSSGKRKKEEPDDDKSRAGRYVSRDTMRSDMISGRAPRRMYYGESYDERDDGDLEEQLEDMINDRALPNSKRDAARKMLAEIRKGNI